MVDDMLSLLYKRDANGLKLLKIRYGALLRYIVSGIISDPRDAEECLNDVYVKIWDSIDRFSLQNGSFKPWLTTVARNVAIDRRRKTKSADAPLGDYDGAVPSPESEVLRRERLCALHRAMKSLPPGERILIYRKYYYLQSTAQIAAELGLTEKAVEGRLYRLRRKLRKLIGGEIDE
ncbi:MAG: RNA polymerase sigma factor [Oscillospiraceae bacterium]